MPGMLNFLLMPLYNIGFLHFLENGNHRSLNDLFHVLSDLSTCP